MGAARGRRSITAIFQDISDQQRVDQLRRRAARLEAVAEVSASLAHEIRNPLASIRSAVEQLGQSPRATPDEKTLTRLIVRESDRLSRLLGEFLDFARARVTKLATVDLCEVARGAANLAAAHPAVADGVRVECLVPPSPVRIEGDEDLLHRAVFNLALNAVQAAPAGGRVTVEVRTTLDEPLPDGVQFEHGAVLLRVSDNGPGHRRRDSRADLPAVRDDQARGIGARSRDGAPRDRVASRAGARRQRCARHALHRAAAARAGPSRTRRSPRVTDRRPKVLIIDDESGILETLEILLRAEGFDAARRAGRQGGPRAARVSEEPDILLTDVRMPGVTGVEILAAARARDPDMPVILMTAQATLQTGDAGGERRARSTTSRSRSATTSC